jgi:hypothetical protein
MHQTTCEMMEDDLRGGKDAAREYLLYCRGLGFLTVV